MSKYDNMTDAEFIEATACSHERGSLEFVMIDRKGKDRALRLGYRPYAETGEMTTLFRKIRKKKP